MQLRTITPIVICLLVLPAMATTGLCASEIAKHAVVAQSGTTPQPTKKPKAVFDTLRHDFGTVMEGERVVHDFMVTNAGSAPLVIKNIQPD